MATHAEKKSARKTTELRPMGEAEPSEQPTKSKFERLLERTTGFLGNTAVILLLAVVVSNIAADWWNQPILIDPLIVPKTMEDDGYTGSVAANRVADEMIRIEQDAQRAAQTSARKDKFIPAGSEPLPDIEIPETKLSLVSAIGFLEDFLHVAPPHVRAELIFESESGWHGAAPSGPINNTERVVISVRMIGRKSRWAEITVHNPDEAVMRAAREVLEITTPYILSMYALKVDHDRETALQIIKEAIASDPKNANAYIGWGYLLDDEHEYAGAVAKYQEALALEAKNVNAYIGWGYVLDDEHDYAKAVEKFQAALELDPENADAYDGWGEALSWKHDYDGAIAQYQQALELDPKNATYHNDWGNALNGKHDHDGAIAQYRAALNLDPRNAWSYDDWGNALNGKHDHDGAIAQYRKALELDPANYTFRADLEGARQAERPVN